MKIHLARSIKNKTIQINGLACVRDIHKKGKIVELAEYVTIPKEDRCHHCDNIAKKITSYI